MFTKLTNTVDSILVEYVAIATGAGVVPGLIHTYLLTTMATNATLVDIWKKLSSTTCEILNLVTQKYKMSHPTESSEEQRVPHTLVE